MADECGPVSLAWIDAVQAERPDTASEDDGDQDAQAKNAQAMEWSFPGDDGHLTDSFNSIREQIQLVAMRFLLELGIFRWLRLRNRMRIKPMCV
jgi:hypothetical protein